MTTTVFGNILVASKIEEAVIFTLQKWLPTYLRYLEAEELGIEIDTIPRPEVFTNRNSFDYNPGDKYPKIVCIAAGLDGTPVPDGSGIYRAAWRVGAGVALAAQTEQLGNMFAKTYGAAIRSILLNYQSLGGIAEAIRWIDEVYEDLPITNQNQLFKSAAVYFSVDCNNVVTKWKGPDTPDDDPYAYGQVEHVIIDLEKVAING